MQMVLQNQLEAFERSAAELRGHWAQGDWAHYRPDVEALMATLVAQFNAIGAIVWGSQDAAVLLSDSDTLQIHQLFQRLSVIFDEALRYGKSLERLAGCELVGKMEFLSAWKEIKGIVASSPSQVEESLEQLRAGGGMSLGDFADELSRDLEH